MDHAPIRPDLRHLCRWVGHIVPGAALIVLFAVANATPPEPLYLKGIQDGGDYDSLTQPLVLSLAGLPDTPVPVLIPHGPRPARVPSTVPEDLPIPGRRPTASRAPPAQ